MKNDRFVAFQLLQSGRANLPEGHEIEPHWVTRFHATLDRFETLGIDTRPFRYPPDEIKSRPGPWSYVTNEEHINPPSADGDLLRSHWDAAIESLEDLSGNDRIGFQSAP